MSEVGKRAGFDGRCENESWREFEITGLVVALENEGCDVRQVAWTHPILQILAYGAVGDGDVLQRVVSGEETIRDERRGENVKAAQV